MLFISKEREFLSSKLLEKKVVTKNQYKVMKQGEKKQILNMEDKLKIQT